MKTLLFLAAMTMISGTTLADVYLSSGESQYISGDTAHCNVSPPSSPIFTCSSCTVERSGFGSCQDQYAFTVTARDSQTGEQLWSRDEAYSFGSSRACDFQSPSEARNACEEGRSQYCRF